MALHSRVSVDLPISSRHRKFIGSILKRLEKRPESLPLQRSSLMFFVFSELPGNSTELLPIREMLQNCFHLALLLVEVVTFIEFADLSLSDFLSLRSGLS